VDLAGLPASCYGQANEKRTRLERLIDVLQKRYDQTRAISADFSQKTYAAGDPEGVAAEGRVYFKRPHLMRWEYEKPARQLIVTSGKDVYIYEIEARQVTVLPRKQFLSSEISRAFFFGKGDLRREFNVAPVPENFKNPSWSLCLLPKRQIPQLKRLFITLDPKSHLVTRVVIEDQMGGKTIIEFSNIRVNQDLPAGLFRFSIPKDVEVYRGQ
jgi:outer membrane lipoprotein carrier protein